MATPPDVDPQTITLDGKTYSFIADSPSAGRLLKLYFANSVNYSLTLSPTGDPVFFLEKPDSLLISADGGVAWESKETLINGHYFIQLTTGENTKKTVYLPFCLVNPDSRGLVVPLIVGSAFGKMSAHFQVATLNLPLDIAKQRGFLLDPNDLKAVVTIDVPLPLLLGVYSYFSSIPFEVAVSKYASLGCPCCRMFAK